MQNSSCQAKEKMLLMGKHRIGVKRKGGFLEEFITNNENNETEGFHAVQSKYASVCQCWGKTSSSGDCLIQDRMSFMNPISIFISIPSCGLGLADNAVP